VNDHPDFDIERPPVSGRHGIHPVVDLNRVPEDRWVEVLLRFDPSTYKIALARFNPPDQATVRRAMAAVGRAMLESAARAPHVPPDAWAHPPGLPTPEPRSARARRGRRQVNFRLGPDHYRKLVRAAELMSMTPTRLAGLLVVRGVDQILREARPHG
jgi:hypothetical protein